MKSAAETLSRLALALLTLLPMSAAASPPDEAPTELDPILVTPQYLYDGDRQLSRIARSLPDMGSAPRSGLLGQLSDFFDRRSDPNTLDPLQQEMLLRTLGESDDRWR